MERRWTGAVLPRFGALDVAMAMYLGCLECRGLEPIGQRHSLLLRVSCGLMEISRVPAAMTCQVRLADHQAATAARPTR